MTSVEMCYLGHSAFLWTADGVRVAIDPYDNRHPSGWRWFVRACPEVAADVVLVTHEHFDHNATHRITGGPRIVRTPIELTEGSVSIVGIEDRHASPDDIPNTIFVLDIAGVRFCHLGDNRAEVPRNIVDAIGDVDVLMVPVDDSSHLLRFWEVDQVIDTFSPRVVVPAHYLIPDLTDPGSTLLPADTWLGTRSNVRHLDAAIVELAPHTLPADDEVWVFTPNLD